MPSPVPIGSAFGFGNLQSLGQTTSQLVNPAFEIAAALVTLYLIFGAFKYLTSGGEKEAVDDARKMMTYAFVGFLILMFAFLALKYLLYALFNVQFSIIGS